MLANFQCWLPIISKHRNKQTDRCGQTQTQIDCIVGPACPNAVAASHVRCTESLARPDSSQHDYACMVTQRLCTDGILISQSLHSMGRLERVQQVSTHLMFKLSGFSYCGGQGSLGSSKLVLYLLNICPLMSLHPQNKALVSVRPRLLVVCV